MLLPVVAALLPLGLAVFVEVGTQAACRADKEGLDKGKENVSFIRYPPMALLECQDLCMRHNQSCHGIEHYPRGFCEVWLVEIRGTQVMPAAEMPGIRCFEYLPDVRPKDRLLVVWLHGTRDASDYPEEEKMLDEVNASFIPALAARGIEMHFPAAGIVNCTPNPCGKDPKRRWWDSPNGLDQSNSEDSASVRAGMLNLTGRIERMQESTGIPPSRTVVGGFSNGGGMSLVFALSRPDVVAAAFSIGSYLYHDAYVFADLEGNPGRRTAAQRLPILMQHGDSDELIPKEWAANTMDSLAELGIKVESKSISGMGHEVTTESLQNVEAFLSGVQENATSRADAVDDGPESCAAVVSRSCAAAVAAALWATLGAAGT